VPVVAAQERGPRAALALIAIVLIAWFAVLVRDQVVGHAAIGRIVDAGSMSESEWRGAMDDLRSAELLDPSTTWRVGRANYLVLRDRREALEVANSVVRREPDNLAAWAVVLQASEGLDPRRAARARREIRRLNPPLTDR
jgi:hypothetical protein